ncbi:unc-104 [Symbiodinium natans]|uniref:Unc-104 protein n=1 Tax=Symbiodinium natans TaxID=878477 RepID=A0A812GNA0_9DINO|nr:unc-104 [Symbiodinium natans]
MGFFFRHFGFRFVSEPEEVALDLHRLFLSAVRVALQWRWPGDDKATTGPADGWPLPLSILADGFLDPARHLPAPLPPDEKGVKTGDVSFPLRRALQACAEDRGDAHQVAEALEQLEANSALWRELRAETWERLRVADAQLRSFSMDEIARLRSCGGSSPIMSLAVDLLRPPWLQMPQQVANAADRLKFSPERSESEPTEESSDAPAAEVLCTVDCHPDLDETGLCWHCWHRDECNGRPNEIQELLAAARLLGAGAVLGHRARLVEQRWQYPRRLASAVLVALAGRGSGGGDARLLVLGGLGVSAVAAARSGAFVHVLEPNETARAALAQVFRANGVADRVSVVTELESRSFDICAIEGLEPDGLLGCGMLAVLQRLQPKLAGAQVLPVTLHLDVALAASRLTAAAGIEGAVRHVARRSRARARGAEPRRCDAFALAALGVWRRVALSSDSSPSEHSMHVTEQYPVAVASGGAGGLASTQISCRLWRHGRRLDGTKRAAAAS